MLNPTFFSRNYMIILRLIQNYIIIFPLIWLFFNQVCAKKKKNPLKLI